MRKKSLNMNVPLPIPRFSKSDSNYASSLDVPSLKMPASATLSDSLTHSYDGLFGTSSSASRDGVHPSSSSRRFFISETSENIVLRQTSQDCDADQERQEDAASSSGVDESVIDRTVSLSERMKYMVYALQVTLTSVPHN